MKYIFFGTPDVAKDTLKRLMAAGLDPVAVVTNPDARRGRGQILSPSPVKAYVEPLGVPVLTPEKLDEDFQNEINSYGADVAIVVAYGKILPESLIRSFPNGVLNIHYSLLPRWRGASPVESALLQGDTKTGVTIQQMVKRLDAGAIVAAKALDIRLEDTTATLRPRLIALGAELLIEALPKYLNGEITPIEQDESEVTLAPKFTKADGELDLKAEALTNWRKYQAYAVWPGTYFFKDGKRHKITKASYKDGKFVIERVIPEGGKEIKYHD